MAHGGSGRRQDEASNDGINFRDFLDLREDVATLKNEMKVALEGVGNFRAHTNEMKTFTDYVRGEFREMKVRDEEKVKAQQAVAEALLAKDRAEAERMKEREKKADRWWRRIVWIAAVGASIATVSNIAGPTVRHFLHTHGFTFIQETSTDAPKPESLNAPREAGLPFRLP